MAEEILYIKADISDINAKLDELDRKLNKAGKDAEKPGEGLADGMEKGEKATKDTTEAVKEQETTVKKATKQIGVFGKVLLAAFAAKAIQSAAKFASELKDLSVEIQQLDQKAKIVFGDALPQVTRESEKSANAIGLTAREFRSAAAGVADILVPLGFARQRAAELSIETTKLAGAISNWSGGQYSAAQSSEILQKALVGETGALTSVGIVIDRTSQAYRDRVKLLMENENLTIQQAKSLEILRQVQQQSADAQAAYATGADLIAVKQAEANAKLREAKEKFAEAITPAILSITNKYAGSIQNIIDSLTAIGELGIGFAFNPEVGANVRDTKNAISDLKDEVRTTLETTKEEDLQSYYQKVRDEVDKVFNSTKLYGDLKQKILDDSISEIDVLFRSAKQIRNKAEAEAAALEAKKKADAEAAAAAEAERIANLGILEALKEQLKITTDLIDKAQSQKEINSLLEKREAIEKRINEILNNRFNTQQSLGDQLVEITQKFVDAADEIKKGFDDEAAAAKALEDSVTGIYEKALQEKIEFTEKKKQDDEDYAEFQRNLLIQQEEATLQSAGYLFGQLKTLYAEDAEAQKAFASFDALLSAFQAINKTMASVPYPANLVASISIGALALANVAKINSTPVPQYFEGTHDLQLGNNKKGRDTIPIMAHEHEAIIPAKRNLQYPGLSKAWITGDLDKYINVNHVIPAINKIKQDKRVMELKMSGKSSASLNDTRIVNELKKSRKTNELMIELLASQRSKSNPYRL